jgi:PAS domain S-box-containing protein
MKRKGKSVFPVTLWTALIIPFIFFLFVITGIVSYIAFSTSLKSVNDISTILLEEINSNIETHIVDFLGKALNIVELNAEYLEDEIVHLESQDDLQLFFLNQVKHEPGINSLYFGNRNGGLADAGQENDRELLYFMSTTGFRAGTLEKVLVDSTGKHLKKLFQIDNFDARNRPWYSTAASAGKTVRSEPYILSTGQDMAVSISKPVYNRTGLLKGVISADVFLSHIGNFLSDLNISPTGFSYIIDEKGYLIASSREDLPPFLRSENGGFKRLSGLDIRENAINSGSAILSSEIFYEGNQNWKIITIIPQSDFMGSVHKTLRMSIWIIILTLACVIGGGIFLTKSLTSSIHRLGLLANDLSEGTWTLAPETHWILEVRNIYSVFNNLSRKIENMIESLNFQIKKRKEAEEGLKESEQRMELALRGANLTIWNYNSITRKTRYDERLAGMLGYAPNEISPEILSWEQLIHPDDKIRVLEELKLHTLGKKSIFSSEYRLKHKSEGWKWILSMGQLITRDEYGDPIIVYGTHQDITGRKDAENQISTLLKEKDLILREVHHRIKNNLFTVKSLLQLQSYQVKEDSARKALEDAGDRISSMLLLYEKLYQSESVTDIPVDEYLSSLVREILSSSHKEVKLVLDMCSDIIPVKIASTLGIIINELISNIMKYAYIDDSENILNLTVEYKEDFMTVILQDNGIGFDKSTLKHGFGLNLVELLVEQIDGDFTITDNNGTRCSIKFRL